MTTCILPRDSSAVTSTLKACESYAAKYGYEYNSSNYTVKNDQGETIIMFYYHGHDFYGVVCPEDFEAEFLVHDVGAVQMNIMSKAAAISVLRARSSVDIKQENIGRYFLHGGLIAVYVRENDLAMQWFGVPEDGNRFSDVTKHVAALLGLLKGVAGNK